MNVNGKSNNSQYIDLPFKKIKSMDRIDCIGNGLTAKVIRRFSAGKEQKNNVKIPVHTAIALNLKGQIFLAEMGNHGMDLVPVFYYQFKNTKRYISGIYRHEVFENAKKRNAAEKELLHELRLWKEGKKRYRYGWSDLLTFAIPFARDSKKARICSELYVERTEKYVKYRNKLKEKIMSPYGLSLEPNFKRIWSL